MLKVSVILPVYNKEIYLERSIDSVLQQSYTNLELIIINDGSTDSSEEVILKKMKEDNRIIYQNQKNQGVSNSRNQGLYLSKGKYISFLDADDKWEKTFLENMIQEIGDGNVCYCGHYVDNGKSLNKAREINFKQGYILEEYLYNKNTPNTNSWLIRKDYIEKKNIYFNETLKWGEDMSFYAKVLFFDSKVRCVRNYLTTYYTNIDSSLSTNDLGKIDEDIRWMTELKNDFYNWDDVGVKSSGAIEALDAYRIPAAIIYRLYLNRGNITKKKINDLIGSYSEYIKKMRIRNGMRSIKLYYIYSNMRISLLVKNKY